MLSNKPLVALSQAERQLLRYQRLQSGQCVRCLHASVRRRAEETASGSGGEGAQQGNASNTPRNQPNRGPDRHQRAAKVSKEVRILSRDVSSLGPAKPQNESVGFEGAAQATAQEASSGRMGENNSTGREGPQAQGVGRPVRSIDDEVDGTLQVRQTRTPNGALEEPAKGGASVLGQEQNVTDTEAKVAQEPERQGSVLDEPTGEHNSAATSTSPAGPRIPGPSQPVQPTALSREQFLHAGSNTSTIAAGNYEGVVKDRIRASTDPAGLPGRRSIPGLAHRFAHKKIVQFDSKQQVNDVNSHLNEYYRGSQALTKKELKNQDKGFGNSRFRPLPRNVRNHLVESVVKGVYDSESLLSGTQKHKQPVLNEIAKMTMMNGTYMSSDGERVLKKVQSLLPIAQTASQRRGAAGQPKK